MNGTGNGHTAISEREGDDEPRQEEVESPYKVAVSVRFLLISSLASCLLAFCLGRAARISLLGNRIQQVEEKPVRNEPSLPSFLGQHGEIPQSRYLSKNFDTSMSVSSSSWLAANRDAMTLVEETVDTNCSESAKDDDSEPSAEHLMVDIRNVSGEFLNSERRLADAMLHLIQEAKLTLLSYHCHGLIPSGVSCVGVLTRNYVSFHTWPQQGVITLDLCAGDSESLLPVVPLIEQVFGVPRSGRQQEPTMIWARIRRGYSDDRTRTDVDNFVMTGLTDEVKKLVASVQTDFQTIDVFDLATTKRRESTWRPNREVFLDGFLQSSLWTETIYHEALVHPGLFAHADPKRVAVVGGGECATLRELLKHDTVEEAIMIEIDEKMVNESRKYMPEWSDCSDIEGSAPWCVDDPRSRMFYEDALAWFVDRYSNGGSKVEESPGQIDVIIMDALDPESEVPFAKALYSNETFMQSFFDSLSPDGILVMQLGASSDADSPDETFSKFKNRVVVMNILEKIGFESIHVYEEGHCGFYWPWTFVVAFKAYETRKRWFRNEAEVNVQVSKRTRRTKSGRNPLVFFDGATMQTYQAPPRHVETVFCRRNPMPQQCVDLHNSFNPNTDSIPLSSLEVRESGEGERSGQGVFTTEYIPPQTYVAPEGTITSLRFYPNTYRIIMELYQEYGFWECLQAYMHGYGITSRMHGANQIEVDSSMLMFANHGCHGEYNIGTKTEDDEFSADPFHPIEALTGKSHADTSIYNPVIDRHLYRGGDVSFDEPIEAGNEILDNYLGFIGSEEEWKGEVISLRRMCEGKEFTDFVTYYDERFGDEG